MYALGLSAATILIGFCEWHTDEDMLTLIIVFGTSLILGIMRPRFFIYSALALGFVVPAVNLASYVTGLLPGYVNKDQWAAHGVGYIASLCVLVLPALLGAFLGRSAGNRMLPQATS